MDIAFENDTLPVLHRCDAVVIGGSFAGIATALQLAEAGHSVTVIEPRTYLGREISATLRPWLTANDADALPQLMRGVIAQAGKRRDDEIALNMDALKLQLEDVILSANIKLLYASLVTGLVTQDDAIQGVIIGNKSGRQVITCQLIVDTSETAITARMSGATFAPPPPEPVIYTRTLEFDNVESGVDLSQPITLNGITARLHHGYRDRGHVLVECDLTLPPLFNDAFEISHRETTARHQTMTFVADLVRTIPAFKSAYLSGASYELTGLHTTRYTPTHTGADYAEHAGTVRGLWHLNAAVPLDHVQPEAFDDALFSAGYGEQFGAYLVRDWATVSAPTMPAPQSARQTAPDVTIREPFSPQRGYPYPRIPINPVDLPTLRTADVLIVGGGSSGASAGIHAAKSGVKTVLLEMNPGLGGTGTYGGVHSYWFGRRTGFSGEVMELTNAMHRYLHHPEAKGIIPKWNIEAKSYALLKEMTDHGAEVLFNCFVIGTAVNGDDVIGVVVATRTGAALIRAEVTIDASGDGDVAAFGGANYAYGHARDHIVMWYALAQFSRPGLTRNHFTSMVDVSNIEDYTRAILAGRRRRPDDAPMHDHGIYVAPRESRHIIGDVVLTLTDQMRYRRWDDVINVCFSNHDVKGHTGSDWLRIGLIPPNLEIEIPYRALLPAGLNQLLVVGKAFSADHDALPAIRMQADLENLGGVAALAAAQAVQHNQPIKSLDVRQLQTRLINDGILPPDVLTRTLQPMHYNDDELRDMIANLPADKPLYDYSDMELTDLYADLIPLVEIVCSGERVIPLLTDALKSADGNRAVLLAQCLALVGSTAGVMTLIDAIDTHLAGERLPVRTAHIRYTQLPPDHGAMPDVVYLLYSLGMVPDKRALPVWQRVIDLLAFIKEDDFYEQMQGAFYYVDAVAFAAERYAAADMIAPLQQLHAHPSLHGKTNHHSFEPDYIQERLAYLELIIGRALARCGSLDGYAVLIGYLNDNRALLAEHAHTELSAITGADYGKDSRKWGEWLEQNAEHITPVPYQHQSDAQRAWHDDTATRTPMTTG